MGVIEIIFIIIITVVTELSARNMKRLTRCLQAFERVVFSEGGRFTVNAVESHKHFFHLPHRLQMTPYIPNNNNDECNAHTLIETKQFKVLRRMWACTNELQYIHHD